MNANCTELNSYSRKEKLGIAKIIGVSFVAMFLLGIFAEFIVRAQLITWEDPVLTFKTIRKSIFLFNSGIFSFIIIIFLDVVLSVAFYVLFKLINKTLAILMVSLRLVYVAMKGGAIVGLLMAKNICSASAIIEGDSLQIYAREAMQFLKMHHYGFGLGLIFFGLHIITLGVLLWQAKAFPKAIVGLLLMAGTGYTINSLITFFADDIEIVKLLAIVIFIIPMTFAELWLGIWLWVKRQYVIPILDSETQKFS